MGLNIYFGDIRDPFLPGKTGKFEKNRVAFSAVKDMMGAESLTFLNQVHGTDSYFADGSFELDLDLFNKNGDLIVTDQPGAAIGILSADCLPIILHDRFNNCIGVVHAGWRGSILGIAKKAVDLMKATFVSNPKDIVVYFGPCARHCCYEVSIDFFENISRHRSSVIVAKKDKFFFDNTKLNFLSLLDAGIRKENISLDNNFCTICNKSYHSYRRDGVLSGRQATVAMLTD